MAHRSPELLHQEFISAAKAKVQHDLHGNRILSRAVILDIDKLLDEELAARVAP